ncbi:MAG: type II toxin-antitoxin system Phd/YefM family antitoxin [Spirochaetota bacterium]
MKFITVRDLRTTPAKIWKDLPDEQEMVITNNGKPIALLTPLTDSDMEDTLSTIRKARAGSAISKMQFSAIKNNLSDMTSEEIEKEIKAARKNK